MARRKTWVTGTVYPVLLILAVYLTVPAKCKYVPIAANPAITPLKCILLENTPDDCSATDGPAEIPERLDELYKDSPSEVKAAISERKFETLSSQTMLKFPLQIFYLIPIEHLLNVSGIAIASVVKEYPDDISLLRKAIFILQTQKQRKDFLDNLEGTSISDVGQAVIAEALVSWYPDKEKDWTFDLFSTLRKVGNPVFAYLPSEFIFNLPSEKYTSTFLWHLREWIWGAKQMNVWQQKPWKVKRAWAQLAIRENYPRRLAEWTWNEFEGYGFFLEGATYDELLNLSAQESADIKGFEGLMLNKLQARSIFNTLFAKSELTTAILEKILNISLKLAPQDLLQFKMNETNLILLQTLPSEHGMPSLPTAKQVVELLVAQLVMENKLQSENATTWHNEISNLGRFVYALPNQALEAYSATSQSSQVLAAIDSDKLSAKQARLLIGSSKILSVLPLRGLVKGIPSMTLSQLAIGDIPQNVLNHLLSEFTSDSTIKSLALLQKVRAQIGNNVILENMLYNKNANQFFELLSSREISDNLRELQNTFKHFGITFERNIKQLPENMLSVLLSDKREKLNRNNKLWTSNNMLSKGVNLTLLGITCNDIATMETLDFIYILGKYNRERLSVQKEFPKHLQYCSQGALIDYLTMKGSLRQREISGGLLNLLDLFEIDAIGGFVLGSLPLEALMESYMRLDILEAIGKLPLPELLSATSGTPVKEYTSNYLIELDIPNLPTNKLGVSELFQMGTLVQFMQYTDIERIDPEDFKFFWESINGRAKALCVDSQDREAWNKLVITAFGLPSNWSAGVLATLGDLLVVVSPAELDNVPKASWIIAADTLVEETSYYAPVEWPSFEEPIPIVKACLKQLDDSEHMQYQSAVHDLMRRYLVAVQSLLGTVHSANKLLSPLYNAVGKRRFNQLKQVPINLGQSVLELDVLRPEEDVHSSTKGTDNKKDTKAGTTSEDSEPKIKSSKMTGTTTVTSVADATDLVTIHTAKSTGIGSVTTIAKSIAESTVNNELIVAIKSEPSVSGLQMAANFIRENEKQTSFTPITFSSAIGLEDAKMPEKTEYPHTTNKLKVKRQADEDKSSVQKQSGDDLRASLERTNVSQTHESTDTIIGTIPSTIEDPKGNRVLCDSIKIMGSSAALALEKSDIDSMTSEELKNCFDVLGSLELTEEVQRAVWDHVRKNKIEVDWEDAGHLIKATTLEDLSSINLNLSFPSTLDIVADFGTESINEELLKHIADKILLANGEPVSWSTEIVSAMGQLMCKLSTPYLDRLLGREQVFLEASPLLGKIRGCPNKCLKDLARIATKHTSYGNITAWTAEDISTLGTIVAGLRADQWEKLQNSRNNPILGLSPSAIKCIPPDVFKTLDITQISSLSVMTAAMMTDEQKETLNEEKSVILMNLLNQVPKANLFPEGIERSTDGASVSKSSLPLILLVGVFARSVFFNIM